jgi:hypothetical protein
MILSSLGSLLKEEEQEEGALLVPRGSELRYLVQEVGWLPLPRPSPQAYLVQLLHAGEYRSAGEYKAETILKLLVRLVFRRVGYQAQLCAKTLLGRSIDHVVESSPAGPPPPPLDAEPGIGDGKQGLKIQYMLLSGCFP